MLEKDFQVQFKKFNEINGIFELKLCKGRSLPFSALAPHQKQALLDISSSTGLYHKISDAPIFTGQKTRFTRPKPFDSFFLSNMDAYVVIMFYIPRKKKNVYYITIEDYNMMYVYSERKSITETAALKFCTFSESYLKKSLDKTL